MRIEPFSLDEHLKQKPNEFLYHYTSLHALLGIVKTRSLWSTNIFYLNDSSEYHHVLKAIAKN
jgi:hypothetical protein